MIPLDERGVCEGSIRACSARTAAVCRRAGKGPVALLDRCPHRAAALSEGRMTSSGDLQCAYHGESPPAASRSAARVVPQENAGQVLAWNAASKCGAILGCLTSVRGHAGWSFNGETGDCTNIPQVSHGGTIAGRTCATALPCVERQGLLWVYPSPTAQDPSTAGIVGDSQATCSPVMPKLSQT